MYKIALMAIIPVIILAGTAWADTTITAKEGTGIISIKFGENGLISYHISDSGLTLEPAEPKFKTKDGRFLIVDRANGLFIAGKSSGEGWTIISKAGGDSQRWTADPAPEPVQRDLLAEFTQRQADLEGQTGGEDQQKMEAAKKKLEEDLANIDRRNQKQASTDQVNVDVSYPDFKETIYDRDDARPKPQVKVEEKEGPGQMQLFLSVPKSVEWEESLRYSVLVTDESRHEFESRYGGFVGNGIGGVEVSVTLRDPGGRIIQGYAGTTDSNGLYQDSYIVPENSNTRGAYTLEAEAERSVEGLVQREEKNSEFYVQPPKGGGGNDAPVAVVEILGLDATDPVQVKGTHYKEFLLDDNKTDARIITINQTREKIDEIDRMKIQDVVRSLKITSEERITSTNNVRYDNGTRILTTIYPDGTNSTATYENSTALDDGDFVEAKFSLKGSSDSFLPKNTAEAFENTDERRKNRGDLSEVNNPNMMNGFTVASHNTTHFKGNAPFIIPGFDDMTGMANEGMCLSYDELEILFNNEGGPWMDFNTKGSMGTTISPISMNETTITNMTTVTIRTDMADSAVIKGNPDLTQTVQVVLDASKSSDQDDTILEYTWDFNPKDNSDNISGANEERLSGLFNTMNFTAFEFDFKISDLRKDDTASASVTVYNGTVWDLDGSGNPVHRGYSETNVCE